MFIQTEATPNPATLKFLPGRPVLGQGTLEYRAGEEMQDSPLAQRLFEIEGVTGVFLGSDFISVTKGDGEWQHLKPAILGAIMEHYLSGDPVARGDQDTSGEEEGEFFAPEDEEIVSTIKELLETRLSPRTAATSPSRASAMAWFICICAAPARAARARLRPFGTVSKTCSGISFRRCRRFARFDRG
jgi:hypothetical protein